MPATFCDVQDDHRAPPPPRSTSSAQCSTEWPRLDARAQLAAERVAVGVGERAQLRGEVVGVVAREAELGRQQRRRSRLFEASTGMHVAAAS